MVYNMKGERFPQIDTGLFYLKWNFTKYYIRIFKQWSDYSILKSFITVKKIGISVHYFSKFWLFDPISKIPERYFRDWN